MGVLDTFDAIQHQGIEERFANRVRLIRPTPRRRRRGERGKKGSWQFHKSRVRHDASHKTIKAQKLRIASAIEK